MNAARRVIGSAFAAPAGSSRVWRGMIACMLTLAALASGAACRAEAPQPIKALSAWVVEWDIDRALAELDRHGALFDQVHAFAVYFDAEHAMFLPPTLTRRWEQLREVTQRHEAALWLTIVNDVVHPDKANELKSPALIHGLLAEEEAFARHLDDVAELAERLDVDGVELDYENLWPGDFSRLLDFARALETRLAAQGRGVSILVEPQPRYLEPYATSGRDLPATVMLYDLHGAFSGPGPKATPAFIRSVYAAIDTPDAVTAALSLGAFHWTDDAFTGQLDDLAVERLLLEQRPEVTREPGAVRIRYRDDAGRHEIWRADAPALLELWDAAAAQGADSLALWRLGGVPDAFYEALARRRR